MKKMPQVFILTGLVLVLSACSDTVSEPVETSVGETGEESYKNIPSLVPVADYTGEEYELRDADPDMEISAEMEAEIETAVKDFFQENYKTEVKMNRYFKGNGYVRAVVESVGDPLFYTEVNVGLEKDGDTVTGVSGVGAMEGTVEQAIETGLVVASRTEQFERLDRLLEGFESDYPVQGVRDEVYKSVNGSNYSTPYYFISNSDDQVKAMLTDYLKNPEIDLSQWENKYANLEYDTTHFLISIELYMEQPDTDPDQEIHSKLVELISEAEGIPRAGYTVVLHDSNIVGRVGYGAKKNSLREGSVNPIERQ